MAGHHSGCHAGNVGRADRLRETARPAVARRAPVRGHGHCGGWHLAHGGHGGRAAAFAIPSAPGHRNRRPGYPLVGQSPAPGQSPGGTQARIVARDRPVGRASRITGDVGRRGRVGLAGTHWPGARPDHRRRARQTARDRIRARHRARRRARPPDAGQPCAPLRVAGAGDRSARRRHPLARPVRGHHRRAHRPRPVRGRIPGPGAVAASARAHRRHRRIGQERRHQRHDGQPVGLP